MSTGNMQRWSPAMAQSVETARETVCALHAELTRWQLVVWTAGKMTSLGENPDCSPVTISDADFISP